MTSYFSNSSRGRQVSPCPPPRRGRPCSPTLIRSVLCCDGNGVKITACPSGRCVSLESRLGPNLTKIYLPDLQVRKVACPGQNLPAPGKRSGGGFQRWYCANLRVICNGGIAKQWVDYSNKLRVLSSKSLA